MIHRSLKISSGISFLSLVKNCNHKGLGIYYLLSAFIFGISGTLISVLMRIELYSSGNRIISPENQNFYNISITLHGFLMIFFLDYYFPTQDRDYWIDNWISADLCFVSWDFIVILHLSFVSFISSLLKLFIWISCLL